MSIHVIIPAFNACAYIRQALISVFEQSRVPDYIIVVDDCSSDSTVDVVKEFPVTVLSTPVNSGHALARNIGIHAATSDYIAWLDADDYWEPNHLEVVCGMLDRFPDAAVACSAVRLTGARSGVQVSPLVSSEPVDAFWRCLSHTPVPAMSAVTRRQPLLDIGGFNPNIRVAPDFDLWLRLSRHHKFIATDEVTANYRWHDAQISRDPQKQLESVYSSRYIYYRESQKTESEEHLSRMRAVIRQSWHRTVSKAWHKRDYVAMNNRIKLSQYVPGLAFSDYYLWAVKAKIPPAIIRTYDRLFHTDEDLGNTSHAPEMH